MAFPIAAAAIMGGLALGGHIYDKATNQQGKAERRAREMAGMDGHEQFMEDFQGNIDAARNAEYMQLAQQQAMGQNLVADRMAADAAGRSNSMQRSAAAAARPGMGGLAARAGAQAAGQAQADIYRQSAMAGLAEQRAAGQFLAGQENALMGQQLAMQQADMNRRNMMMGANQLATQQAAQNNPFNQMLAVAPAVGQFAAMGGGGGGAAAAAPALATQIGGVPAGGTSGAVNRANAIGGGMPNMAPGGVTNPFVNDFGNPKSPF